MRLKSTLRTAGRLCCGSIVALSVATVSALVAHPRAQELGDITPTVSPPFAVVMGLSTVLAIFALTRLRRTTGLVGGIAVAGWIVALVTSEVPAGTHWEIPGTTTAICWLLFSALLTGCAVAAPIDGRPTAPLITGVAIGVALGHTYGEVAGLNLVLSWIPNAAAGALLLAAGGYLLVRSSDRASATLALVPLALIWSAIMATRGLPSDERFSVTSMSSLGASVTTAVACLVGYVGWRAGSRARPVAY